MKKIIIALIILSQSIIMEAQCVNGTSTNPSNPINNQIFGVRPELVNIFPENPDSYREETRIGKKAG